MGTAAFGPIARLQKLSVSSGASVCQIKTLFRLCAIDPPYICDSSRGETAKKSRSPATERTTLGGHLGSAAAQKLFYWQWKMREVKLRLRGQCHGALAESLYFLGRIEIAQDPKP